MGAEVKAALDKRAAENRAAAERKAAEAKATSATQQYEALHRDTVLQIAALDKKLAESRENAKKAVADAQQNKAPTKSNCPGAPLFHFFLRGAGECDKAQTKPLVMRMQEGATEHKDKPVTNVRELFDLTHARSAAATRSHLKLFFSLVICAFVIL